MAGATAFRSESMIAVALLVLVVLHVRARPIGAGVALLAGALAKETALVLAPLLIVALEVAAKGVAPVAGPPRARNARAWLLGAEVTALAIAVVLRLAFAPAWRAGFVAMSTDEAVGTRLASVWRSATLALAPIDRTICDAFTVQSLASVPALAGLAVAAGVAYLAWRRRGPALLMAVALLPSLNLVPVMRWWSPHYLYVPLAFGAMVVADAVSERLARSRPAAGVALVVLLSAGGCQRARRSALPHRRQPVGTGGGGQRRLSRGSLLSRRGGARGGSLGRGGRPLRDARRRRLPACSATSIAARRCRTWVSCACNSGVRPRPPTRFARR